MSDTPYVNEAPAHRNLDVLSDFSMGCVDSADAIQTLGQDGEEELFVLMAQARPPMPRLSRSRTDTMIEMLDSLPRT